MKSNTKIIATLSDKTCTLDLCRTLFEKGMRVARLNTAHLTIESAGELVKIIRSVSNRIAILIDTKGPEVRTDKIEEIEVKCGQKIVFTGSDKKHDKYRTIKVNYPNFVEDVKASPSILIDDGATEFEVLKKDDEFLICEVLNNGIIKSSKSVNVPDTAINLPSLTEKDKKFIAFAVENNIDFIAHSFVRNKEDVFAVKEQVALHGEYGIPVIAKIENREGVDNIDEILDECFGIMVARGDLGVEIPLEEVPLVQKHLVSRCIDKSRSVIIATQMLESMIENPRPTRAETSDVANAVIDGADAIMLSGETAYGKFPVEAVETMSTIANRVESAGMYNRPRYPSNQVKTKENNPQQYIIRVAMKAALEMDVTAIVIPSRTGKTVQNASSYRMKQPIYAGCYSERVFRRMQLCYGVYPLFIDQNDDNLGMIPSTLKRLKYLGKLEDEDFIVCVLSTIGDYKAETNQMRINQVSRMLSSYEQF